MVMGERQFQPGQENDVVAIGSELEAMTIQQLTVVMASAELDLDADRLNIVGPALLKRMASYSAEAGLDAEAQDDLNKVVVHAINMQLRYQGGDRTRVTVFESIFDPTATRQDAVSQTVTDEKMGRSKKVKGKKGIEFGYDPINGKYGIRIVKEIPVSSTLGDESDKNKGKLRPAIGTSSDGSRRAFGIVRVTEPGFAPVTVDKTGSEMVTNVSQPLKLVSSSDYQEPQTPISEISPGAEVVSTRPPRFNANVPVIRAPHIIVPIESGSQSRRSRRNRR